MLSCCFSLFNLLDNRLNLGFSSCAWIVWLFPLAVAETLRASLTLFILLIVNVGRKDVTG